MNPLQRLMAPFVEGFRRIEDAQRFASLDHDDDLMAVADAVQDEPIPYGLTGLHHEMQVQARIERADFVMWLLEFDPASEFCTGGWLL